MLRQLLCKFICALGLTITILQVAQPYIYQKVMAESMDVHHSLLSSLEETEVRQVGHEQNFDPTHWKFATLVFKINFWPFIDQPAIQQGFIEALPHQVRVIVLLCTFRI